MTAGSNKAEPAPQQRRNNPPQIIKIIASDQEPLLRSWPAV
jgi:hypothetical protein